MPITRSALPARSICSRSGCEMASSSTHVLRLPTEATRDLTKERAPKWGDYSVRRRARIGPYPVKRPPAVFESHRPMREETARLEQYCDRRAEIPPPPTVPKAVPKARDSPNPQDAVPYGLSNRYTLRNSRIGACRLRPS